MIQFNGLFILAFTASLLSLFMRVTREEFIDSRQFKHFYAGYLPYEIAMTEICAQSIKACTLIQAIMDSFDGLGPIS